MVFLFFQIQIIEILNKTEYRKFTSEHPIVTWKRLEFIILVSSLTSDGCYDTLQVFYFQALDYASSQLSEMNR